MTLRLSGCPNTFGERVRMPIPEGPKYPHIGVLRVSALGIVSMVLGRYLLFGYLDPQGMA